MTKDFYVVRVPCVPGVPRKRMLTYTQEAVEVLGGQLRPQMASVLHHSQPTGIPITLITLEMKHGRHRSI